MKTGIASRSHLTKRNPKSEYQQRKDDIAFAKWFVMMILGLLVCCGLLIFSLAPPRLVLKSPSPDQTMRIELWTQGFFGRTWADLIWQNQWKKEHVYDEEGNEVIWSKDAEVIWSKDSRQFFIASISMIGRVHPHLLDNQYLYLASKTDCDKDCARKYPAVVLTYDIAKKELRHNLHRIETTFDRRDLQGTDWTRELPK
jgi:hypothetical protein